MTEQEEMKAMENVGEEGTNEVSSDDDDKKTTGQISGTKRPSSCTNEDEKKAERRAANRRSAFQSRQRRKILIEDLQKTVSALSNENTDLRKNNEELRVQLEATLLENHQFRVRQQLGGGQPGVGGLLGASSLQSAQTQALLRGQGGQATLAQLLGTAAGGSSLGSVAPPPGENTTADPLLNARLALAAAQTRVGELEQSQEPGSSKGVSPPSPSHSSAETPGQNSGLQGILDAASLARAGSGGAAGSQIGALQGLLQGGAGAGSLSGLQGLLDARGLQGLLSSSPFGRGATGSPQLNGLTDIQRAILQGAGGASAATSLTGSKASIEGNGAPISDALRNLLQRNQGS